jgi:MFS family permease
VVVARLDERGPASRRVAVDAEGATLGLDCVLVWRTLGGYQMQGEGIARSTIALFMLVAVLGGLGFQVPIGRLSDRFDRRAVLAALGLGFAGAAIALVHLPHSLPIVLPAAALLGGLMSTLYPVCVAHAHDHMPADRVVAVSGGLVLLSGLGSIAAPLIGASLKASFSIDGVLYFMAAATLLLAFLAAARSVATPSPRHLDRPFEILAPQAAALAHDPFRASGPLKPPDPA